MTQSRVFQDFVNRYPRAIDAGIIASAYVYYNEVKRRLAGGYTTGDYVTGAVLNAVTVGQPFDRNGVRTVMVGAYMEPNYPAFWEFGHHNVFTGRYERVEHWRESMLSAGEAMEAAFGRAFRRVLGGSN